MKDYFDSPELDELWIFLACVATLLFVVFLASCASDDPERMRVQAEGTQASHDRARCRAATLDRAQPASAPRPC
jgi:hypothetical protein